MGYRVEGALWESVFAVPGNLADEHLKLCGGAALKVLLLVLRKGADVRPEWIAGFLGLPPADVLDALNYWIHLGVLTQDDDPQPAAPPIPVAFPSPPPPLPEREAQPPPEAEPLPPAQGDKPPAAAGRIPGGFRRRLTTRQIAEMGREDQNIAFILQEAQMILGKPLTPVATDTVAALYSYYGMQPEVILMLLQYCLSQGKDNMRYIEKAAAGWVEAGVDTHEKAEREILRASEREKLEHVVRRLFGIQDRALIAAEREYIAAWKEQAIPTELIGLAYERTVEQKGKLSFAYLNGILQNWRGKGISTPRQAMDEMRQKKTPPPPKDPSGMDEMEQIYHYGDI